MRILILVLMLVCSCATSADRDWGPWKRNGVSTKEMRWHFCREDLDGPELHRKGVCYQSRETRTRKTILGNIRSEHRTVSIFCAWGDVDCLERHDIFHANISNREDI